MSASSLVFPKGWVFDVQQWLCYSPLDQCSWATPARIAAYAG